MIFSDLNTLARETGFTILGNSGPLRVLTESLPVSTPSGAPPSTPAPTGTTAPAPPPSTEVPAYVPVEHMDRRADLVLPWYQSPTVTLAGLGLVALLFMRARAHAAPVAGYRRRRRR